jgi:hypothetical protein
MNALVRVGAYAGGLALAFAAAYGVGAAAGPVATSDSAAPATAHEPGAMATTGSHAADHGDEPAATGPLPGLAVAQDGYTLQPVTTTRGGSYRVFADFTPSALGRGLVLGTDVSVAGAFSPVPLPAPAATTSVDGYDVALTGRPVAGEESELTFTVRRAGREVTDLQPYLGAFGHLVSLRTGDLAYLHTHPAEEAHAGDSGGPTVRFATEFPTAGTYRLFLDFRHGGAVHTAALTVHVTGSHA